MANGLEMIDAPIVTVDGQQIFVDGNPVPATELWESKRHQRIDGLFSVLKSKHELAKQLQPNKPVPTTVVMVPLLVKVAS